MCFLGKDFWLRKGTGRPGWTSIPPCPLTAAHSPSVSRRTQKADPVFTLKWGLPCQHHGYHPETGPSEKHQAGTSMLSKVAPSSEPPSTRHAFPTCYATAAHSPLPPFGSISRGLFHFLGILTKTGTLGHPGKSGFLELLWVINSLLLKERLLVQPLVQHWPCSSVACLKHPAVSTITTTFSGHDVFVAMTPVAFSHFWSLSLLAAWVQQSRHWFWGTFFAMWRSL